MDRGFEPRSCYEGRKIMLPVEFWLAIHAVGSVAVLIMFLGYGVMTIRLRLKIKRAARTWGSVKR